MRILLVEPLLTGAVAQMGERMTGSHEVRGSIPLSSTRSFKGNRKRSPFFLNLNNLRSHAAQALALRVSVPKRKFLYHQDVCGNI